MKKKIDLIAEAKTNQEALYAYIETSGQEFSEELCQTATGLFRNPDGLNSKEIQTSVTKERGQDLAGYYIWNNGQQSIDLDESTEASGVLFDRLENIRQHAPEVAKKLETWQQNTQSDGYDKTLATLASETIVLYIPERAVISKEWLLEVILSAAEKDAALQLWVYLAPRAEAVVTINQRSSQAQPETDNFFGSLLQVFVDDSARLILNEIQDFHEKAFAYNKKNVTVMGSADLQWNICELGAAKAKSISHVSLAGRGANAFVNGLYFPSDDQSIVIWTRQDHMAPDTTSNLLFKGAVKDTSIANWQGMIYVDPVAAKTDGYQKNENLILSSEAVVNSKPGLEIITDDVRCSHGTTITQLDPTQIFYLMSRGIPEPEAEKLIIQGFFDTILDRITYEPVRTKLQEEIVRKMAI